MKLRELMKLYDLKLNVQVIQTADYGEQISVTLEDVAYKKESEIYFPTSAYFPGWGNTLREAVKNYIKEMRQYDFICVKKSEAIIRIPRITSF